MYNVYIGFNDIFDTSSYVVAKNEKEAFKLALPLAKKEAEDYFPESYYAIPTSAIKISYKNVKKIIEDSELLEEILEDIEYDSELLEILKGDKKFYLYVAGT